MALTTHSELQKQLSVIFGFKGQLNIEVGEIVGIGSLSAQKTESLIKDVLNYLNAYNSMLRDYAGCKLYSIEFDLENFANSDHVNLMPKSMLYIPGEYKDCNTLLLLLAPEMSILDNKKAKQAISNLGKLYFEVEEAINRKELNSEKKQKILTKFAKRFALKLQGNVIEGKWNKKLVGLQETQKFDPYLSMNIQKGVNWESKEIMIKNPQFRLVKFALDDDEQFDFLKYKINQSSSHVISKNTYHLTSNLLNIANTGTIDDTQKQLLIVILKCLIEDTGTDGNSIDFNQFKLKMAKYISEITSFIQLFHETTQKFIKSGFQNNIEEIINKLLEYFPNNQNDSLQNRFFSNLAKILKINLLSKSYSLNKSKIIRTVELESPLLIIEKSLGMVLRIMKKSLPEFFKFELFLNYTHIFISRLQKEFDLISNKSIQALSKKLLEKFKKFIRNNLVSNYQNFKIQTESEILDQFQNQVRILIETFLNQETVEIEDLLGLCKFVLPNEDIIKKTIESLIKYPNEIEFLWGLVLRASTLQRFIKEFPKEVEFTPKNFASLFIEFLQKKRLGGLKLTWKNQIYDFINQFGIAYQKKFILDKNNKNKWSKTHITDIFVEYIGQKVKENLSMDGFITMMKKYIESIAMKNIQYRSVLKISEIFSQGIEVFSQFPDFLRQLFYKTIESFSIQSISKKLIEFVGLSEGFTEIEKMQGSYFNYIIENEMKYFSKLIARPKTIILESLETKEFHKKRLFHKIEFQSLNNDYSKVLISSNFNEVKPKYHK